MGRLSDLMNNADGSRRSGVPYERPNTTPAEQGMTPLQRAVLAKSPQHNHTGWW